jgi:SAM-dependent methyltransferase
MCGRHHLVLHKSHSRPQNAGGAGATGLASEDILVKVLGWPATILQSDPLVPLRWLWLRRHLRKGPGRTLDAGCGSGAFTMYAAKIGNEAVGISINRREVEKAACRAVLLHLPNARFIEGDLRMLAPMSGALGKFDQVICCETIEHILDDAQLLRNLGALLRPGGQLLLTTRFKYLFRLPGEQVTEVEDGNEVRWGYTLNERRGLFQASGLDVVRQEHFAGIVSYVLVAAVRILSKIHARAAWLLIFPLRVLRLLDAPLTRLLRFPPTSVAVVGVKRAPRA